MHTRRQWAAVKARCWFEEEPRADFIRNIAPWDADDLDADRSRGLRLDSERPLIKVLPTAASGRGRVRTWKEAAAESGNTSPMPMHPVRPWFSPPGAARSGGVCGPEGAQAPANLPRRTPKLLR